MIPTTLLGLALFVVLLAPGLAYVLRHERSVPAAAHSPFRESLRVLFVSVACLVAVSLVLAGIRFLLPDRTPNVGALALDPGQYFRAHHVEVAWWSLVLLGLATLVGFGAADPRLVRWLRRERSRKLARALLGDAPIIETSAWYVAMEELRTREGRRSYGHGTRQGPHAFVGALMTDGSYVSGFLVAFNTRAEDIESREIVLTLAQVQAESGEMTPIGSNISIISARHVARLDVSYVDPPATD